MRVARISGWVVVLMWASAMVAVAQISRPGGERLGKVHFEPSCVASVAGEFDHAMALLHSFEFADATAGFNQVLAGDPSCGIAQWGVAMSAWGNPFGGLRSPKVLQDGLAAAQKAHATGAKTERERAFIAAVLLLYKDADRLDHRARTLAYERAMQHIYKTYPKDLEAAAFYALAIDQTAPPGDKTFANQLKAAAIVARPASGGGMPVMPGMTGNPAGGWAAAAIPARWAAERGQWADAAAQPVHASQQPFVEAITRFTRALGFARSGNSDAARKEIDQLEILHEKEIQAKDAYWATQVDIQRQAAEAWALWADGKKDDALRTLTAAAALEDTTDKSAITPGPIAPAHELLGEMLLEANRPADALKGFEVNLKKEPNRFRST